MNAPFYKFGAFGDEFSLVVAVIIGVLFGFFLERAGFGNGRKLAAQFYFRDMAVFKVMFSAIVTAMLGVFYLSWAGLLDIELVYVGTTYLYPQLLGGLLLGIGFILGGYCPGTSIVAVATGRLDAVMFAIGVFLGILGFGEAYPLFADFMNGSN
ncbi:MAG: YeeE/YedE thiosulfate transporter family protein, partial [Rhodothermales bacterium]